MADVTAELVVEANTEPAVSGLGKLANAAKTHSSAIEKSLGAIKVAAGAALAFVAGKEIIGFFAEGIDAAVAQEKAMAQLSQQLKLTGEFSNAALEQFGKFADEMEKSTKYADDVVLSQVAVAKSFGLSNEQAQGLVVAAADLAAATGGTLEGAVEQLGKTTSGTTGLLAKQIPALKGLTEAQLKAGEAIKIVGDRFKGSANAEIQTYSGAIIQAKNAFGNLAEAIANGIVQNATVVKGIQTLGDVFTALQAVVDENGDAIREWVATGVKVLAISVDVAVDVLAGFVTILGAVALGGELAFTGLAEGAAIVVRAIVDGFGDEIAGALDVVLGSFQTLIEGAAKIPLLGAAFDTVGIDADGAAKAIADVRKNIKSTIEDAAKGVEEFASDAETFTGKSVDAFQAVSDVMLDVQNKVHSATEAIVASDSEVSKSADQAADARKRLQKAAALTAEEQKKLLEEFRKLQKTATEDSLTDIQKIVFKRDEELAQLAAITKKMPALRDEASKLSLVIEKTAIDKLVKLREEADAKALEEAKKAAAEQRAAVEKAAADPVAFSLTFAEIKPADLDPVEQQLAGAAVGLLGKMVEGAAGAKSLIASGAGAFADAFIPGIGAAVTPIVAKLAEGKDATKKFIREFINAIPDIIEAIAEATPALVEAFVDTMVNKGGALRIAIAIAKGMAGEGILKAIGKQLGLDAGSAFNSSNVGQTMAEAFQRGTEWIQTVGPAIQQGFENGVAALTSALQSGGDAIRTALADAPRLIGDGFATGLKYLRDGILQGISSVGSALFGALRDGGAKLYEGLKPVLEALSAPFRELLKQLGAFKFPALPAFPSIPTPGWLNSFINAVNNLTGGGGGGKAPEAKAADFLKGKHATGALIPQGFPNDTYIAGLTSGERVLSVDQNEALMRKLDGGDVGGDSGAVLNMLARIAASLDRGQMVNAEIKLGSETLARAILNINRQNGRVA